MDEQEARDRPFLSISYREVWDSFRTHEQTTPGGGHADHEQRIRSLELRYYGLLAGVVGGVLGAAGIAWKAAL